MEIFLKELSVLKQENCFHRLCTVCNFMLSVWLYFVGQSILYSGANLPDMTDGPTVFREVDGSIKQIQFLKS